jgi:hypothetical protein
MPVSCAELAGNLAGVLASLISAYPAWKIFSLLRETLKLKNRLREIQRGTGDEKAQKRKLLAESMVTYLEEKKARWGALNWTISLAIIFAVLSDLIPFLETIGFSSRWLCYLCSLARWLGASVECPV